ncbi:MAG: hypothetical protein AAFZ67_11330 [Planctomycetota bacterium]
MPGTSTPAPYLLTAAEAAVFMRLDQPDRALHDAIRSLDRLCTQGVITPIRIGRHRRFLLPLLLEALDAMQARATEVPNP